MNTIYVPLIETANEDNSLNTKVEIESKIETDSIAICEITDPLPISEEKCNIVSPNRDNNNDDVEDDDDVTDNEDIQTIVESNVSNKEYFEDILENINDMKVADLKNELEKLNQKIDGRPRKDQLAQRLRDYVTKQLELIYSKKEATSTEIPVLQVVDNKQQIIEQLQNKELINDTQDESMKRDEESISTPTNNDVADISVTTKRKLENEDETAAISEIELKKMKIESSAISDNQQPQIEATQELNSQSVSPITVKGHHLSLLSLNNALNPHRFDQFEVCFVSNIFFFYILLFILLFQLIVIAEFLRDSLVVHFARYIFSTLIHNYHSLKHVSTTSSLPTDKVCFLFQISI